MMVGITGGIGSGKSLVATLLGEMLRAPVHSSDEICRRLLQRGEAGYQQVLDNWGESFLTDAGDIDRALLRSAVFADQDVRRTLEAILHPLVRLELLEAKNKGGPQSLQIAEVPLLFECGWAADFDYVVCVTADPDLAVQRVVDRDVVRPADVEMIVAVQMDPLLKAERSDWVIDNGGSLSQTKVQVQRVAAELRALQAEDKSN